MVIHSTHLYHVSLVFIQSQDLVLGQKVEEGKQMKQDLQRAQSLFTSAERELRYEKEKNLDLKKHNTLLDQEKLKVSTYTKKHNRDFLNASVSSVIKLILVLVTH